MTDNELNQLRQNLRQQFHAMMAEELPVDTKEQPYENQWQRNAAD